MKLSLLERYRLHRAGLARLGLAEAEPPPPPVPVYKQPPPIRQGMPAPKFATLPPPNPQPPTIEELAERAAKARAEREAMPVPVVEQPPAPPAPDFSGLDLADRIKAMLAAGVRIPPAGAGRDRQPHDPTREEIRARARECRRQWRAQLC